MFSPHFSWGCVPFWRKGLNSISDVRRCLSPTVMDRSCLDGFLSGGWLPAISPEGSTHSSALWPTPKASPSLIFFSLTVLLLSRGNTAHAILGKSVESQAFSNKPNNHSFLIIPLHGSEAELCQQTGCLIWCETKVPLVLHFPNLYRNFINPLILGSRNYL